MRLAGEEMNAKRACSWLAFEAVGRVGSLGQVSSHDAEANPAATWKAIHWVCVAVVTIMSGCGVHSGDFVTMLPLLRVRGAHGAAVIAVTTSLPADSVPNTA